MDIRVQRYVQLLTRYLGPQWFRALMLAVFLFSGIALQLVAPQILRSFIDQALSGMGARALLKVALLFLGVGLLNQLVAAAATYFSAQVAWTATNHLREDLARHCLRLDMPFHNDRTPGEMIERVDGDVTNLSNFFSQFTLQILGGLLLASGVLVLLFRESQLAGVLLTLYALVAAALLLANRNIAVEASKVQREASSRLFGFLEEKLSGLEDIRANAGGPYVLDRFFRINHHFFHASHRAWMRNALLWVLIMGLFYLGHMLALGIGVYLFQADVVTIGTVFLFIHYTELLRHPIQAITRQVQDMQNAIAGISRIDELFHIPPDLLDGPGARPAEAPPSVVFDHVTFAYREDEPVLRDFSFTLQAGRTLGLVGRTGSGKTTIARLLFRLYEAQQGTVRLGGVDLREMKLDELRRHIGMVTQDVQLFEASIRDNLTFFNPDLPDARILAVLDELGLLPWFERLPEGLDTRLTSGGDTLSAGEAQLLAFTRIFLREPGLVILDEPSSRMDPVTERLVQGAVDRLLADRTAIIIAHRLDTLRRADDILIVEDGRVKETGPRAELARDLASHFHHLLEVGLEAERS